MNKPFKTYLEQINLLKSRGLRINNEDAAQDFLKQYNYYNLVNGYKELFIQNDKFIEPCSIDDIVRILNYDRELQSRFLSSILIIENMFKSVVAYEFAKSKGPTSYKKRTAFNCDEADYCELQKMLNKPINASKKDNNTKYDAIRHYISNYNSLVPIWVLVNNLTFDNIIKFYSLIDTNIKSSIAISISKLLNKNIGSSALYNYLTIIKHARNICAHGGRIYCFRPPALISTDNSLLKSLAQQNIIINKNSLNSLIMAVYELSASSDFYNMILPPLLNYNKLIETYPYSIKGRIINVIGMSSELIEMIRQNFIMHASEMQ